MSSVDWPSLAAGLALIGLGGLFLLDRVDAIDLRFGYLWPALLAALGATMLAAGLSRRAAPRRAGGTMSRVTAGHVSAPPAALLRRDVENRVVAGVCAGFGRRMGIDPVILRVAFVVAAAAGGVGIVLYALAWLLIPADRVGRPGHGGARPSRTGQLAGRGGRGTARPRAAALPARGGRLVQRRARLAARARCDRHGADLASHDRSTAEDDAAARAPETAGHGHARARPARSVARRRRRAPLPALERRARRRPRHRAGAGRGGGRARADPHAALVTAREEPRGGARGAHPLAGAGRAGRPPARLRPADARARPAPRRRPARRRGAGPAPGTGAARLALREARGAARGRASPPRSKRRPRRSRMPTT